MATKKQWTSRRQTVLENWVNNTKPQMGLSDWSIHFNWEGSEETSIQDGEELPEALATMAPFPSSRHAIMTVSRELLALEPEDYHQVLVHELTHCYLFSLHEFAISSFASAAEDNILAQNVFNSSLNQHIEQVVDALADNFLKSLPVINLQ